MPATAGDLAAECLRPVDDQWTRPEPVGGQGQGEEGRGVLDCGTRT